LGHLWRTARAVAVVVDGSFVTSETSPSDIDLLVVQASQYPVGGPLTSRDYALLSQRMVKSRFGVHMFLVGENTSNYAEWLGFFQGMKHRRGTKGILRVKP